MTYKPVEGDKVRFTHVAGMHRRKVYRIDQVILTDESQILGIVVSVQYGGKRLQYLYDLDTFLGFDPVKVGNGGQVESAPETSS